MFSSKLFHPVHFCNDSFSLCDFRKYSLKKVHKVIHKPDPKNGDRFLLNLEFGFHNTNQSFRLSEHVYQNKGKDYLCLPEGMDWNNNATVYFILPVKDQENWVHYFINQLTDGSLLTGDTNFHVIIVDFESKDINMSKVFNTSLLSSRHTIVSLTGKFFKTLDRHYGQCSNGMYFMSLDHYRAKLTS